MIDSGPVIRWVCASDLHLGALNSVLTNVTDDGMGVDGRGPSPVMAALGDCLRTLPAGGSAPQLVVLGDLFELALTPTDLAATTFGQLVSVLRLGQPDASVSPVIRFVPGNHDHRLWTLARDDHFVSYLESAPAGSVLSAADHITSLLPATPALAVRDRFTEALANRGGCPVPVEVVQSYPNLGLIDAAAKRAVVMSHGHFTEPIYRLMTGLDDIFGTRRETADATALEADNGGWIDFFWSSMGDSGDVSGEVRRMYESLNSVADMDAEIAAIARAIRDQRRPRPMARVEARIAARLLRAGVSASQNRERHRRGDAVMAPQTAAGLVTYLQGPVAAQLGHEVGHPVETTFVFGHTHKPFVQTHTVTGFPGPVRVVNTGGWVVDSTLPEPVKGAAIVVIDDDLNVAILHCYQQGSDPGAYRVQIKSPGEEPNPLVEQLSAAIDPGRDPWLSLAEAAAAAVAARTRQLAGRLNADIRSLATVADKGQ
jgi:UDP-2,3-diacylglucosamine pyrophosphatase LpxH